MSTTLTISGKVMGKTRPMFTDWELMLPEAVETTELKLRSLLTHLVRAEVSTLLESLDLKEVVFTFDALHCQKKH
jgi:hypothetical protein